MISEWGEKKEASKAEYKPVSNNIQNKFLVALEQRSEGSFSGLPYCVIVHCRFYSPPHWWVFEHTSK